MFKRLIFAALAAIAGWAIWRRIQETPGDHPAPVEYRPPAQPATAPSVPVAPAPVAPSAPAAQAPVEAPPASAPPEPTLPQPLAEPEGLTIEAYCVRCKERRTIVGAHEEMTASGRRGARGICPVCGGNVFTFLPSRER